MKPVDAEKTMWAVHLFVAETIAMMNEFATKCDKRLKDLWISIDRSEIALAILEGKLSSIGGIESNNSLPNVVDETVSNSTGKENSNNYEVPEIMVDFNIPERYRKLLSMGMAVEHVKLKMSAEGIDSSGLENFASISHPKTSPESTPSKTGNALSDLSDDVQESNAIPQEIAKYVKMAQMGVPLGNVKQKMEMEGHDPSKIEKYL